MKFTPSHVHFIPKEPTSAISNIRLWSQINVESIFESYKSESASDDEIYIELSTEDFVKVFKPAQIMGTQMKLAKKDGLPVLSFDILAQSRNGKTVQLIQTVPVQLLTRAQADQLQEPMVPDPDIHIMMPNITTVKNIVDKLKSLSTNIVVAGNMNGELRFHVESDYALVETFFNDLENPELDTSQVDQNCNRDKKEFVSVRVDSRDLFKFSHCHLLTPDNVVCCLMENHGIVFYVYLGSIHEENMHYGLLTYYLPMKRE